MYIHGAEERKGTGVFVFQDCLFIIVGAPLLLQCYGTHTFVIACVMACHHVLTSVSAWHRRNNSNSTHSTQLRQTPDRPALSESLSPAH